jgi:hypothetical protein
MFYNCTAITTAPELPATTLAQGCYNSIFYGCSKLTYIKVHFNAWLSASTNSWVGSVKATGTFECPSSLPQTRGSSNIPSGWTVQTF